MVPRRWSIPNCCSCKSILEDRIACIPKRIYRPGRRSFNWDVHSFIPKACWATIHRNFEWLQERAQSVSNNSKPKPKRTVTALLRRFKLIKEHQTKKSSIRALYNEWKEKYASDSLYSNFNHKDNKMSVSRNESSDKGGPPRPSKEATSTIDDSQVVQALKVP